MDFLLEVLRREDVRAVERLREDARDRELAVRPILRRVPPARPVLLLLVPRLVAMLSLLRPYFEAGSLRR